MIKEEFSFQHINDYLYNSIDLLIAGFPNNEERSCFFSNIWKEKNKNILLIRLEGNSSVICQMICNKVIACEKNLDLCVGLPRFK